MAKLQNDVWKPFDEKQGQISSKLLDECFIDDVQNQLKSQIEANKHLKPLGRVKRRSEVGTIVILCGIWFKTLEDQAH